MDKQWRNGSKQFVDFTVTLTDPAGELTLAEVQSMDFELFVGPGLETPLRDGAGWLVPSVAPDVTAIDASFKVAIMHLYEATAKGIHGVFVKFGPTPEEPIYLAAQFVVL